ncbi:unnamed protein product [Microthlaspi erraticum]|uniref:Arabidopsis retrotransposon Orf1 C-terminal domain-containing protein n=1 Tax=Microthlaspi erraticum TaxID=1685480 RepID=A0A6D2K655_9BRAS|nr:unnamed protein product [Microthlaspi erraticum]
MEHQGRRTPKSWATIAEEGYSSSRSKAAQIRSPVLRYVHKALANTFFARKATGQSMRRTPSLQVTAYNTRHQRGRKLKCWRGHHTYLCAAGVNWTREGLLHQVGWTSSFARPTSSLSTRSWMGDSNSSSHPLAGPPSFSCPTLSSPRSRGENIDFRPPVYTLVGHEEICEKRSLSSIELRIELRSS